MKNASRKTNTRSMILCAIFCALIIVMTVVPYTGYISYGLIEITTLHIVTIIAAVVLGPVYGSVVGAVWGATCILRCLLMMPQYAPFGFANFFVAFLPRLLVGTVSGLLYNAFKKTKLRKSPAIVISAVAGSLTNTVLVLSAMTVYCKMHGLEGYETATVYSTLATIVATLAGLNGILEIVAAIVIVPAVANLLAPRRTVLGIDVGASTTKLVLVRNGRCIGAIHKGDTETLDAAIERLGAAQVSAVRVTGVGSESLTGPILGIVPERVDEFRAISRGATKISRKSNCIVVSLGTGTSFTRVTPFSARHIGGSGLGGGVLKGLSERFLNVTDMETFHRLALAGDLGKVDLQMHDITTSGVTDLHPNTTAANLAKLDASAAPEDVAAGIANMVFESIGVMAAFAARHTLTKTIVLVGTITDWAVARKSLDEVAGLHGVTFIVPDRAAYAGAIGAALND